MISCIHGLRLHLRVTSYNLHDANLHTCTVHAYLESQSGGLLVQTKLSQGIHAKYKRKSPLQSRLELWFSDLNHLTRKANYPISNESTRLAPRPRLTCCSQKSLSVPSPELNASTLCSSPIVSATWINSAITRDRQKYLRFS